jgi:hypothetical protein
VWTTKLPGSGKPRAKPGPTLAEAAAGMASGTKAANVSVSAPERSRRTLCLILGNIVILSSHGPGNLSHPTLEVDLTIAADVNRAVVKMTKLTCAAALSRNCRVQVRCHDPRAMCCVFILHAALCHGWDRLLASPGRYMRRARMTTGLRPAVIARGDFPGVMNSSLFMHPPFWDESDLMVLRKSGYLGDVNLVKSRRHNDERRPAVLSLCQFPRQTVLIGPSLPEYLSLLKNSLNLRLRCIAGVC